MDVRLFLEQLLFFLRNRMKESLKKTEFGAYANLFEVFEGVYGRLKFSPDPFLLLETSVFRCIATTPTIIHTEPVVSEKKETKIIPKKEEKTVNIPPAQTVQKKEENLSEASPASAFDFAQFIEHIRTVPKRSFVGLGLRVSTYSEEGKTIIIHPDNDFNYKKLDSADVRLFLQETLDTLFGAGYTIDIQKLGTRKQTQKPATSLADEAADIF